MLVLFALLLTGTLGCTDTNARNAQNGVAGDADCEYTLKIGAAVPKSYEGEWGIEAATNEVNKADGYIELGSNKMRFVVEFTNYAFSDSAQDADQATHATQMNNMMAAEDFVIGGGPWFAEQEVLLTNQANMVNVLCCTGPDKVYEKASQSAWNGAFGVHGPPENYPKEVIREAEAHGATKIAIIWAYGNVFTTQVASKNKELAEDLGMTVTTFQAYPFIADTAALSSTNDGGVTPEAPCPGGVASCENRERLNALAQKVYDDGAEVVVVCGMNYDSYQLASDFQILDPYNEQFKAIFFTVGATKPNWMAETMIAGQYITSGGQWDPNVEDCGDWFGPGWPSTSRSDYCSSDWNNHVEGWVAANKMGTPFETKALAFGSNYETASGAVALYTLLKGIHLAYKDTTITFGNYDQTLVRDALKNMHVATFFGSVGFNNIQRNTAKETAAVQWLPNADGTAFEKKVIYPQSGREVPHVYPIPQCKDALAAEPDCREVDDGEDGEEEKDNSGMIVIIVVLVVAVLMLIAVVMYMRSKSGKAYTIEDDNL